MAGIDYKISNDVYAVEVCYPSPHACDVLHTLAVNGPAIKVTTHNSQGFVGGSSLHPHPPLQVSLGGYHHKQGILLSKIMNRMSHFTVDQKRFGIFKEMLSRYLRNFRAEQPHTHAMYYCNVVLEDLVWTRQQMAEALEGV